MKAALFAALVGLSACALFGQSANKLPARSRVGVATRLVSGRLQLQVVAAPRCLTTDEGPCPESVPVPHVAVTLRTTTSDRPLGTTGDDGTLSVAVAQLDAWFPVKNQRVAVVVEDKLVSELAIDDVFRSLLVSAIHECDAALADPELQPDYAQALLGRMLDLRLLGLSDERLVDRTTLLAERIRREPAKMWSTPQRVLGRNERLIDGLYKAGEQQSVPSEVQRQITGGSPEDAPSTATLRWAVQWLPTVCQVTVKGGELAGQLVLTGAPGIALAILDASVGDVYSDWMIKSCCQRLSGILGAGRPAECEE